MSGSKPKKQTVGYRYYRSMQMGLCHGPIDALRSVWVKDKVAWSGNARRQENGMGVPSYVDQPGLFGGEDGEGGVSGWLEICHGAFNQLIRGVNSDGTSSAEPIVAMGVARPALPLMATHYRGVAVVIFHDFYWGTNPYLSDMAFEVETYWREWFPEAAQIGIDANPVHIILECVVNDQWGLGYSFDQIDLDAARYAAAVLFNEGIGLSMAWSEQQSIEDFINTVMEQIDGSFYFNQRTGKWTIRLVREGDPVVMALDPSNFRLDDFQRRGIGETVNELTVKWVNPETEEFQGVTVQDLANIAATGQTIPGTKNYPGVRSEALAGRLATRDVRVLAATLATATGSANREAWNVNPGDIVTLTWPAYGIANLRMRVTQATHKQDTADIPLQLIEDVFGQSNASFTGVNPPGWVDTRQPATQFDVLTGFELPFWFVFMASSGVIPEPEVTYGAVLPVTSNTNVQAVNLFALRNLPSTSVYELQNTANITPSALLNTPLSKEVLSTTSVLVSTLTGLRLIESDSFAVIGTGEEAEIVRVVATFTAGQFQIQRGLMDTHPRDWPLGTRIFFIGENQFPADPTARSMAEVVNYKVTMQTSISATTVDDVPVTPLSLVGRQGRPYPVGNVTIGGTYWPQTVQNNDGYLNVSFSTRNRLLQNADAQVQWSDPSVTPEAGSSVLVFAMRNGAVVASVEITNPLTNTAMLPLGNLASGPLTVVVRTLRGDLDNYQDYTHTFTVTTELLSGWGADWGADWGD